MTDVAAIEGMEFLSTPSARRATVFCIKDNRRAVISIHALREEGDDYCIILPDIEDLFLSTPSARRATPTCAVNGCILYISIHALREEGDRAVYAAAARSCYFYPRPPRGGRRP